MSDSIIDLLAARVHRGQAALVGRAFETKNIEEATAFAEWFVTFARDYGFEVRPRPEVQDEDNPQLWRDYQ